METLGGDEDLPPNFYVGYDPLADQVVEFAPADSAGGELSASILDGEDKRTRSIISRVFWLTFRTMLGSIRPFNKGVH